MAIISTKAIVISTIKYGDSSLISKLYTRESGLVSYVIKGVLKSKKGKLKAAYFQPLTQLHIVASHQDKRNLQSIREAQITNIYATIHSDIVKQSVVIFLSEMISNSIQEEETNQLLYDYLESSFSWLDSHDHISNFHLLFLLNLTKFLGFYPEVTGLKKKGFHLREGIFTDELHQREVIRGREISLFKQLLGMHFDEVKSMKFSKKERHDLLRILIRYFELHLDGFKNPKSLKVLEAIYSK